MGKYSLIALDIDGTLLNSELKLTEGNREAIRRAAEAGKHVVLSTGRCLAELRDLMRELPQIRYVVCENGSCVYDCKYEHTIHVDPVPVEETLHILDVTAKERVVLQVFNDNQSYFNQKDTSWTQAYRVGNYDDIFKRCSVFDVKLFERFREKPFRIEKINVYFENARDRDRVSALLADRPMKRSNSIGYMIEMVSEMADKGRGLQKLCDHLKLPIGETIAVGDSMNDIEVLRAAGFSAAMGNACPEAKAAAHIVTADCDHDGVAEVIYKYLLAE